ncbi:efflux RND transporter periplasmic adaptor subunit [Roseobacter sp.]|uniref:efflux RND transporter periplasmic adaptor subunit n=1 Tax=Roseobacter sp. TaxID=1907202 RepID=UPI0025E4FA89|nr:efflux RND transporter periplasmic adaptor subunit [Roseobacter sp.]
MMRFPDPLRAFAISAMLILAAGASPALAQGRAAAVGVETVETRSIAETIPLFAKVVTSREGTIASRIAGTIDRVLVLEGVLVAQGEVLAELDTELLSILNRQAEARRAEASAGVATAEARTERALNALNRIEGLRDTTSFSTSRFDEAQGNYFEAQGQLAEAEARVQSAEAALAETRYQLERARITAPFTGIVLDVHTNPGEFISSGAPVVSLLDISALEVEASVPARYISVLKTGLAVKGTTETGEELDMTVRVLLPVEDPSTRTRPVRFTSPRLLEMPGTAIGQSLTVSIPISKPRDVLSVPKDALVQARGGWTVFVSEDGKAQPRMVQIGVALGDRFEVLDGLAEGDVVVTRGNERLRPGQDIAPAGGADQG